MRCPKCNTENADKNKFCTVCGAPLTAAKASEVETPVKDDGGETGTGEEKPGVDNGLQSPRQAEYSENEGAFTGGYQQSDSVPVNIPQSAPASNTPPKKSKAPFIIGGVVAALAVLVIAVLAVTILIPAKNSQPTIIDKVKQSSKDPKDIVIDAFKDVYSDEIEYPVDKIFGLTEMAENSRKVNTANMFSLKIKNSQDETLKELAGSGITMSSETDVAGKKASTDIGVQYGGADLANAHIYMDDKTLMMSVPELSEKVFTLNYGDDLSGQIDKSPFLGAMIKESGVDITFLDDYMKYVWSFYNTDGTAPFDLKALWKRYRDGTKAIEDFKAALEVERADTQSFTMNGKSVKCKGFDVVVSKESIVDFLRTSSKFFMEDETLKKDFTEYLTQIVNMSQKLSGGYYYGPTADELQDMTWGEAEKSINELIDVLDGSLEDVTMKVYVDGKGRLASVEAETTVADEYNGTLELKADLKLEGGAYPTQNMDAVLEMTADGETVTVNLSKQGVFDKKQLTCDVSLDVESSNDYSIGGMYTGTYNIEDGDYHVQVEYYDDEFSKGSVSVMGTVTSLEKGKAISLDMDTIDVKSDGLPILTLSGDYSMEPLAKEVKVPNGEQMDILAASQSDWEGVIMEMQAKVMKLMEPFMY